MEKVGCVVELVVGGELDEDERELLDDDDEDQNVDEDDEDDDDENAELDEAALELNDESPEELSVLALE